MARLEQPRRRFAPEPIETTFATVRKGNGKQQRVGPDPEPTPDPSPRSSSPMALRRPRRRFAPQLIETSRRSRKRGDKGPATRPTDKTDITPYTRHIYTATKHRGRRRWDDEHDDEHYEHRPLPPTRRETEEEAGREYLLQLAAEEAERQMQQVALLAFPNSHVREGNVDHYYFREGSDSDSSSEVPSPTRERLRRKSSNLAQNWWHEHMREHASHLDHDEMAVDEPDTVMHTDSDLDDMDLPAPPDPMWTTTNRQDDKTPGPIGESHMPLIQTHPTRHARDAQVPPRSIDLSMPYMMPSTSPKPVAMPYASASQIPPDTGFRSSRPSGRPFGGGLGHRPPPPPPPPPASRFQPRPKHVSPPMLGRELTFRRCPSPQSTKLEPDHLFTALHAEERHRDLSGRGGLWRGYCFKTEANHGYLVPADLHAPHMMATPFPPGTPGDPDSDYGSAISGEPTSLWSPQRIRTEEPRGLHMLHGLDERLKKEKAKVELDEKIQSEFDDSFVTQVYNYLSLGYPATARSFDDELSKISTMSIDALESDDEKRLAKGHLLEADDVTPREQRCPRWTALRTYITEWARQHPNLDNLEPTAWGVRERRGSWAI